MEQRELKFRCWDDIKKQWRNDALCSTLSGQVLFFNKHGIPSPPYRITSHGHEYVITQFTGLKDKNGKEIYDGDIVRYHYFKKYCKINCDYVKTDEYKIGSVEYIECGYHLVDGEENYKPSLTNLCIDSLEVIGNIFENKDLKNGR